MDKKQKELNIVQGALSILGITASEIEQREAPDFELRLADRMIGLEVTEYHSDLTDAANRSRRAVEEAWDELRRGIMNTVNRRPKLTGTKGRLEFKEILLPTRKEKKDFIEQLLQLAIVMVTKGATAQAEFGGYPILEKYLLKFTLKNVFAYVEWSWNYSAEAIAGGSMAEAQLLRAVKVKAMHRYDHIRFSEIWLIIATGFRISQSLALLSDSDLQSFTQLDKLLQKSCFTKAMIYDTFSSIIYLWPGWKVNKA